MVAYPKPLPQITPLDRPYWEGCRRKELLLQRCDRCAALRNPPSPICPDCGSLAYIWTPVSGKGRVFSWVVFHQLYFPGLADELPYNVAIIRLDDGPLMIANLIGMPNEELRSGMPVTVCFEEVTPEITIPKFRKGEEF